MLPSLAQRNRTIRLKVRGKRTATTCLQLESDADFFLMIEVRALRDKTMVVVMWVTNLIKQELELELELRSSSKHLTVAKGRGKILKRDLGMVKETLLAIHVERANFQWRRIEMVRRKKQVDADVNRVVKAVSTCSAAVCAEMCLALPRGLDNVFQQIATELVSEEKWMMVDVRGILERGNANVYRDAAKCAPFLRN